MDTAGDLYANDILAMTRTRKVRKDSSLNGSINLFDVKHAIAITGPLQTLGAGY